MLHPDLHFTDSETPWLLDLASIQTESDAPSGRQVYEDEAQMTYVREPTYEPAIDSAVAVATKKADRETGEDQKGF